MSEEKQMEGKGKFYTLFIDDVEYRVDKQELTGKEIMDLGSIPYDVGLLLILEDGTQVQVGEDEVIELKPGRRFKKAPRFKRG
ncbi:MAG: multiubiquitin domain-containing protein [Candidatus Bathyarchaeota archaeon]|nr:multiubiquitin domain-containing protein [Candidatus Bathyarchaeota archaeon]MDH5734169.1 multiubiquitin domain-containing protein [Candidatus Bathyarchaeota archaeon]